jgi:hypothetical protein
VGSSGAAVGFAVPQPYASAKNKKQKTNDKIKVQWSGGGLTFDALESIFS